jgi:hypothetical protein
VINPILNPPTNQNENVFYTKEHFLGLQHLFVGPVRKAKFSAKFLKSKLFWFGISICILTIIVNMNENNRVERVIASFLGSNKSGTLVVVGIAGVLISIYAIERAFNKANEKYINNLVNKLRILMKLEKYGKDSEAFASSINNAMSILSVVHDIQTNEITTLVIRIIELFSSDSQRKGNDYLRDRNEKISTRHVEANLMSAISNLSVSLSNPIDVYQLKKANLSLRGLMFELEVLLNVLFFEKIRYLK